MKFINPEQVRLQINKAASQQTPFFFTVNYEMSEGVFIENPMEQSDVLFHFNGVGNKPDEAISDNEANLTVYPTSKQNYLSNFQVIQSALKNKELDVINLTARTPIKTNIDCREIFLRSQSPYQVYIPNKFVCFSPERFVKIENGKISTNPMKGTIDASIENAEQLILNDGKEIAEHTTTSQLLVEELELIAHNVTIKRFRYIDQIVAHKRTLLQVSSEIEGELPTDYRSKMGDILFALLPAVSITGSPKVKAQEYISMAEDLPRGYYCGIAGYFDGNILDTTVLIRFIEIDGANLFFRSGGGLTINSDCDKEYQEVLNKIYLPFV